MTEPWFNPNAYAWIPGTLVGVAGAIEGVLSGVFASRGKCKVLVMGVHLAILLCCGGLLAVGIAVWLTGQPYGIWYGLGFPGLLGLVIFTPLTWVVRKQYIQAELRKSIAKDL